MITKELCVPEPLLLKNILQRIVEFIADDNDNDTTLGTFVTTLPMCPRRPALMCARSPLHGKNGSGAVLAYFNQVAKSIASYMI